MKIFTLFLALFSILNSVFASYVLRDASGVEFRFNQPPERIACISPSTTELIFAIGADKKLIANSRYCRFPQEATKKIKIGGYFDPNFEKIAELSPDIFILTLSKNDIFSTNLARFNIPVFYLHSDGLENIQKNIEILGALFQEQAQADALNAKIDAKIAELKESSKSLKPRRVVILFGQMAAGKNSYVGDLLAISGAKNIMANSNTPWIAPEKEYIIASDPEIIILEAKSPEAFDAQVKALRSDFAWAKTSALKKNQIYPIDSDLISIPCSHIIDVMSRLSEILQSAEEHLAL